MELSLTPEMTDVSERARTIARRVGGPASSHHLLLALMTVPNEAARLLTDRSISADDLLEAPSEPDPEPEETLEDVYERAERIARGAHDESVAPRHILAALVRETDSRAYALLADAESDMRDLRTTVMGCATGRRPLPESECQLVSIDTVVDELSGRSQRERQRDRTRQSIAERLDRDDGPSPIDVHPSLEPDTARDEPNSSSSSDRGQRRDRSSRPLSRSTSPPSSETSTGGGRTRTRPPGGDLDETSETIDEDEPSDESAQTREARDTPDRSDDDSNASANSPDEANPETSSESEETTEHTEQPSPEKEGSSSQTSDGAPPTDEFEREARRTAQSLGERLFDDEDNESSEYDASSASPSDEIDEDASRPSEVDEASESTNRTSAEPSTSDGPHSSEATDAKDRKSEAPTSDDDDRDGTRDDSDEDENEKASVDPSSPDETRDDSEADSNDNEETSADESPFDDASSQTSSRAPSADVDLDERRIEPDPSLAEAYELDPEVFPNLTELGHNLTREAALGELDPVVGRDEEILELMDILGKRRANNPMLVGEPGVGKTAIVAGLARRLARMAARGQPIGERIVLELELGRVLSGTELRGSFSERLVGLKDEVEQAGGDIIVFLDEIHTWMEAGGDDGASAADELKTAMARGDFPCIGATTNEEFRTFVESDPAFQRRCQVVLVEEPDLETALEIAEGVRPHYEAHHGVEYTDDALEAAVRLSRRYIHDRQLPDKAIGVIDLAGSRAARTGVKAIERHDIAEVVADMAGLPVDRLTRDDRERYLDIESHLRDHIVGQDHVIASVSEVIRRNYAGFRSERPIGSLLFLGPTGVGKTETVKVLADFLFHDRDAVVQLDMSEYMESHAVSRFVGAPPGYVGHDQGGQLTEEIRRRPYQIVLLDEIEKAHSEILNVLLQLFEEGRLTDGKGRDVDFSNALVVMTSNLGSEVFEEEWHDDSREPIGFGARRDGASNGGTNRDRTGRVLEAARRHFSPELWNRIDEPLVFEPLSRSDVAAIAKLQLEESAERIASESGVELMFEESLVPHLIDNGGYDPELGARPMRQTIQRLVESEVAELILKERAERGDAVCVRAEHGDVVCEALE